MTRLRLQPWQMLLLGGATLCALFAFVAPLKGNGLLMNALGLSPVVATLLGVRMHRPETRSPWLWCAAGLTLFWIGDLYTIGYSRIFGGEVPFPSIGDGAYIAVYPLLMLGLMQMLRLRNPERDRAGAIDSVIITIGLSLLSWLWLISPYLRDDSIGPLPTFVSIAYPIGDILLLGAVTRLAVDGGRREPAFHFMLASILALLATDFTYGLMLAAGTYDGQVFLDVGWIAFYVLWGVAALHPSMRGLEQPAPQAVGRLSPARLALLSAATLVAPVLAIIRDQGSVDLIVIAAASAVLFLLVVARMAGLVRLNERAVAREQILSAAGAALVAATDRRQAAQITLDAAARLAGRNAQVRLAGPGEAPANAEQALVLPLTVRGETRGALEIVTPAPLSAGVREALGALVTQVAMALEGADLNEEVARRRSEARFGSLVRHSSDLITVLEADGTISYQSPSIERVLGYPPEDVVGRPFHELLDAAESSSLTRLLTEASSRLATVECALRHRDGGVRQFEVQYTDLLEEEHVRGIVLNARDISERKAFEEQLAHQAFHDPVTNLANRALFVERVRHAIAQSLRDHQALAVLFFDLDDFKTVNDSLGHAAGDDVLLEVGKRLSGSLRASDTAARFGGDEFAVLLEGISSEQEAAETAERLLEALAVPFTVAQKELSLRASLGIAVTSIDGSRVRDADDLIRDADAAMYIAKRDGKGTYRMFEPEMHEGVVARLELKADLQRALSRDEFELYYQPLVRLSDGGVVGFEALLRWHHPERGTVAPNDFIGFAEETGLIVPIGRWVLREGCRRGVALQAVSDTPVGMSINLSVKQLQHSDVVADVRDALEESGLEPSRLTLEITETVMMADTEMAVRRLSELKKLGVRLAMDDFGTGYSSLSYLNAFPVDVLKMDRSFLRPDAPTRARNLASAVIAIGTNLELEVVAEGIEDAQQWASMRSLGAHLGQGFHFARPMDAAQATDFLRSLTAADGTEPAAGATAG
jgi:diguanylate cyclase (GGDEF)-like protein/PAS domain S-box-containing protein